MVRSMACERLVRVVSMRVRVVLRSVLRGVEASSRGVWW
jgi:hypothetical protein